MASVHQRFEVDRELSSVYEALSRPLEILESLPAVTGVRLVTEDIYGITVGPVDNTREVELHIASRVPHRAVGWRTADGAYSGQVTLEQASHDRTAVTVQADAPAAEGDAAPTSAIHDTSQALKRALQSPQVRITRGASGGAADLRKLASDWRAGRSLFPHGADPFALMRNFSRQVDRVFGDLMRATPAARLPGLMPTFTGSPKVDVCEQDKQVRVCLDVPGVDESQLEVDIDEGTLTVTGERRDERAQEGGQRRSELHYGRFTRRIPLPQGIDKDGARATLRHGVLEIVIPLQRSQPRRVPVTHASDT